MDSLTEEDLVRGRNLLRLAAKSTGYLEGYNAAVVDIWKWLRQEGHQAVADQLRQEVDEAFKHKYPVDWPNDVEAI